MRQRRAEYQVVPYPKTRRWLVAMFRTAQRKRLMHALLEVDVTRAREVLKAHAAASGESLSFTAFLIACLAKAVDEHKEAQAFRKGRKRLVLFDDVDVWAPIEYDVAGQKRVLPHIVREANRKGVRAIHHEIRAAQRRTITRPAAFLRLLPGSLFRPYFWLFAWVGTGGIPSSGSGVSGRWA